MKEFFQHSQNNSYFFKDSQRAVAQWLKTPPLVKSRIAPAVSTEHTSTDAVTYEIETPPCLNPILVQVYPPIAAAHCFPRIKLSFVGGG